MRPPKNVVDRAKANGSIDRASILLSAAYLLNSEAYMLIDEAADILHSNGLLLGELKQFHNGFMKATDNYFREFNSMVKESGKTMEYLNDLDDFDKAFRKWAKLKNDQLSNTTEL